MQTKLTTPSIIFQNIGSKSEPELKDIVILRHPASFLEDNPEYFKNWKEVLLIPFLKDKTSHGGQWFIDFEEFRKIKTRLTEAYS